MNKSNIPNLPSVWAILPEAMQRIQSEVLAYAQGLREHIKAQGVFEVDTDKAAPNFSVDGDIGVLRIEGVLMPKGDFFSELFGGVSALDVLTRDFKLLLAADEITGIVLHIDSPGGHVTGMFAFAEMVFEARKIKPVFTFSDSTMVSAAMLIGSAAGKGNIAIADQGVITGGLASLVGHMDFSSFQEKIGIRETIVSLGKNKIITDSNNPLSKEGREDLEKKLKHVDDAQMEAIARFRETTVEAVRAQADQGRIFVGAQAIRAGLIDHMMPFDEFMHAVDVESSSAIFSKN